MIVPFCALDHPRPAIALPAGRGHPQSWAPRKSSAGPARNPSTPTSRGAIPPVDFSLPHWSDSWQPGCCYTWNAAHVCAVPVSFTFAISFSFYHHITPCSFLTAFFPYLFCVLTGFLTGFSKNLSCPESRVAIRVS